MSKTKGNSKFFERFLAFNKREKARDEIIKFFEQERDEKIGIIAAEKMLDFILESIGKDIYEKGIEDSKEVLKKRFEDIELDLDSLQN